MDIPNLFLCWQSTEVKMVDCKLAYLKSKAQKALISLRSQHGTQPPPVGSHDKQNSSSHKLIQQATTSVLFLWVSSPQTLFMTSAGLFPVTGLIFCISK